MSTTGRFRKSRSERVASVTLPQTGFQRAFRWAQRGDVIIRVAWCALAALLAWAATFSWAPPFAFRSGFVPDREVLARVDFGVRDEEKTRLRDDQVRSQVLCTYDLDRRNFSEIRESIKGLLFSIQRADDFSKVDQVVWRKLFPEEPSTSPPVDELMRFLALQKLLRPDVELKNTEQAIMRTLERFEQDGLLENLQHDPADGSQTAILVRDSEGDGKPRQVEVQDVRIAEATIGLDARFASQWKGDDEPGDVKILASGVANVFNSLVKPSLTYNIPLSNLARQSAIVGLEPILTMYRAGKSSLAAPGEPIGDESLLLLRAEYGKLVQNMSVWERLAHSASIWGMYAAVFVLCGLVLRKLDARVIKDMRRLITLLALGLATVLLSWYSAGDKVRAEIIPLLLWSIMLAIAYGREVALLLSTSVALIVVVSLGQGLPELIIVTAGAAGAILHLGPIRKRKHLLYVAGMTAIVIFCTTIGVGVIWKQTFGFTRTPLPVGGLGDPLQLTFMPSLLVGAAWNGFCSLLVGLLITGMLPAIEKVFDIQTELSLLEWGDVSHPLLQELVRRAPGTYNHSIIVASIAEAAAKSIGANGLLVRVGAYFHDIGKMLKPSYFVENQGQDANRHDTLLPAMSTLVIIAHVKDGIDLARRHKLPQSIIDFIEQHHGTTLVEYFYREAAKRSEDDPDSAEVDESAFRYPGPKPQTKETGILMIADAVESASRALVDPTPSRIESLVHDLAMKRLLDGQFEECGLTLRELSQIEESLTKSLIAVYHGRMKYPSTTNIRVAK
jgi:putative nucleotidyltransferase with HDIG domain